jgi:hypothetical protein
MMMTRAAVVTSAKIAVIEKQIAAVFLRADGYK